MRPIDHFVYSAPDLEQAAREIADALDVSPTVGGNHPGAGSRNMLMSLGERSYLEIYGLNPDAPASELPPHLIQLAASPTPDISTYAVAHDNLQMVVDAAERLGLTTSGIEPESRRSPDGVLLEWAVVIVTSEEYGGLVPFFIDWKNTAHPAETSPKGALLSEVFVTHPTPGPLREIYNALGIDVEVRYGNKPGIFAVIEANGRTMFLSGSGENAPD